MPNKHELARCVPLRTAELPARATLKQLRKHAGQTQEELAATLRVGQDTISRLERRSDMLLSTLRQYVESIGGELTLVASFPGREPVLIDHLGAAEAHAGKRSRKRGKA